MTLCEKLIDLRRKAGLSQEQMAQQLDVSRQAVSKWETGDCVYTDDSNRRQVGPVSRILMIVTTM